MDNRIILIKMIININMNFIQQNAVTWQLKEAFCFITTYVVLSKLNILSREFTNEFGRLSHREMCFYINIH